MYAVIKTGGKQYRVEKGDVLLVEKLDAKEGDKVKFDEVVLVSDNGEVTADKATLSKVVVSGKLLEQTKGEKVVVFKYKAKKGYKKKQGHRQQLSKVLIEEVKIGRKNGS